MDSILGEQLLSKHGVGNGSIDLNLSKSGGLIHNCLKNDAGITAGHLPHNIMFYKINTDFNIVN